MLNIAGSTQYHVFSKVVPLVATNVKLAKIPRKEGMTKIEPNKYHPLRLPHGQLSLSESVPTIGVVIPSVICPLSRASATMFGCNSTIYVK